MKDYTFFGDHLFDPENKEELKQKLNKLLMQEDDTNYLRISEQIKQRYSWKTGADKLYSLLRDTFSELC
jgi:glycosyltransferase involved in cell wall biosynthesis